MSDIDFIKRFEAFARSKPADEKYDAGNSATCALAQFGYPGIVSVEVEEGIVPIEAYGAIFHRDNFPCTFGALAERLSSIRERMD